MNDTHENFDSPWKEIVEIFLPKCMELFFPIAYTKIAWNKKFRFLDKELQQILYDAPTGKQFVDTLVEVQLKNGQPSWILIHIEVQSQKETDFARRMYIYNYRIYEKYKKPTASFAILADRHLSWRPNHFEYTILGSHVRIQFPVAKILDFQDQLLKLEKSDNPFAIVVMTHLKVLETKGKPEKRYHGKLLLARMLYRRSYTKKEILALFRFIDWVMRLPQVLETQFWDNILKDEEVKRMPYVMSIERIAEERGWKRGLEKGKKEGIQKGIQQGIQQGTKEGIEQGRIRGLRENILEVLRSRFRTVPKDVKKAIQNTEDPQKLKTMFKHAIKAESFDEFKEKNL